MKIIFLAILLVIDARSQDSPAGSFGKHSPRYVGFMTALYNYYGCRVWEDGHCAECAERYIFNDEGICKEVPPTCKQFNRAVGICQQCYFGYSIYNGQCVLSRIADSVDKGCATFSNGKCTKCSKRWHFDPNNVCQQVDDQCRKWDPAGRCQSCYLGYQLKGNQCELLRNRLSYFDANCGKWQEQSCVECAERAYFGPIGFCVPVSDYCQTWDKFDGVCLTCYRGYQLHKGRCLLATRDLQPPDPGCQQWDWERRICLKCSNRWVFDEKRSCKPVSQYCKEHDEKGNCSSCFNGYKLQLGNCEESTEEGPADLGCRLWDWQMKRCLRCSSRWTSNQHGRCQPVSDFCKAHSQAGKCTACYRGYSLSNGICILSAEDNAVSENKGCRIWDWQFRRCLSCSNRWFLGERGICEQVSDQCKSYNKFGKCTSCYDGYELASGQCSEEEENHCAQEYDGQCRTCYLGYKLVEGECVAANFLCKAANEKGECLSCFNTYVLYRKECVPLVNLVNLAYYYAECCPAKLQQLKREGRIV